MSILIKGMEMPKSCTDCRFHKSIYCTLTDICTNTAQCCPLVPVPKHGRLIDADALEEEAQKRILICDKNDNQFQKPYEVMRAIALAPTIIPAEEDE